MTVRRNFSSGVVSTSGSNSKTYSFGFTAQAGSQLIALVHANATASAPAGWLKSREVLGSYAAYLFTKIAVGTETSISWTQNGDRPAVAMVWEYDTPMVTGTEFYAPAGNGVPAPLDLYGAGAAVIIRLGTTSVNTAPDITWTGATELADRFVWSSAESNGDWVSCAEIAYTASGQHMVAVNGMPGGGGMDGLTFVSSAAAQTEHLAQYAGGASTTHTITFDRASSAGYDVLVFGIGDGVPSLPAGWVQDHLRSPSDCSFIYRLPGASNTGASSVALTYPVARQMAAVVIEGLVTGAPVYANFLTASGNIVGGGTLIGTGLHTFASGGTEFAVFWRSVNPSQSILGSFSGADQGYSIIAQAKVESTGAYMGHFVGLARRLNGTGMSSNGVTASLSPPIPGVTTSAPASTPGIVVYTPREPPGEPPVEPPAGAVGNPLPHMLSDGSQWHPVLGADHTHAIGDLPDALATDAEVTAAITAHEAAADPHPVYLTQTEGDARYTAAGAASGHTIQDEGAALATRSKLNFKGSGVLATDDLANDATIVTVSTNPVQATWSMGPSITATTGGYKWRAKRAYTITKVSADLGTAPGAGESFGVDVTRNGVSVLSSSMAFSSGDLTKDGALSLDSLVTDDVLEVMVSSVTGDTARRLTVNVEMV